MLLQNGETDKTRGLEAYDICGNRIVLSYLELSDQDMKAANYVSNLCWHQGQRIADGVACLSPRQSYIRFCFFNPDGSFESVCGNALFAISASLGYATHNSLQIHPFGLSPIELFYEKDQYAVKTSVEIGVQPISVGQLPLSLIHNTGSPHLVVLVDDVRTAKLSDLGLIVTQQLNVNFTIFSVSHGKVFARTYERGVYGETDACGTGAMAVAIEAHNRSINTSSITYPGGTYSTKVFRKSSQTFVTLSVNKAYVELTNDRGYSYEVS